LAVSQPHSQASGEDNIPIYLKNEKWNQVPEPETQQCNYLLKFAIRNSVNNQIQAFLDVKKRI
jgi:hypothetical protein